MITYAPHTCWNNLNNIVLRTYCTDDFTSIMVRLFNQVSGWCWIFYCSLPCHPFGWLVELNRVAWHWPKQICLSSSLTSISVIPFLKELLRVKHTVTIIRSDIDFHVKRTSQWEVFLIFDELHTKQRLMTSTSDNSFKQANKDQNGAMITDHK